MKIFLFILLSSTLFPIVREDIYDDSWALLIGIDKYHNMKGLDYAVKDAESVQKMLVDLFEFNEDNIIVLKDEEATKSNIIQEFSNITKKAKSNDRVLIFFAGHGETESLPSGGEIGYFVPVNGDKKDLYVSSIRMDELQTISRMSEAKHILCLVDACYGGLSSGSRGLSSSDIPNYIEKITQYKARQIISAGGRDEEVIEKPQWGHSAFTKNLLNGLEDWMADSDNDGIITTQELGTFLKTKVTIDSDNQQTPKIRNIGDASDEGEFVFFQHSNFKNPTISSNNQKIVENNTSDDELKLNLRNLNWEYIRDSSFGWAADDYGHGLFMSRDSFINDGKNSMSFGMEALFYHQDDYFSISFPLSIKKYFSPYSDNYFTYGLKIANVTKSFDTESKIYYGLHPYFGIGFLSDEDVDHSDCDHSKIGEMFFKFMDHSNLIFMFGYRYLPDEALEINAKTGFFITVHLGTFFRSHRKETKILPMNNE